MQSRREVRMRVRRCEWVALPLVLGLLGCGKSGDGVSPGGGSGGNAGTGGAVGVGGTVGSAGSIGEGGGTGSGGIKGTGGATSSGGASGTGDATGSGSATDSGGATSRGGPDGGAGNGSGGGSVGSGGAGVGGSHPRDAAADGRPGSGGSPGAGGTVGSGGASGTGGAMDSGAGGSPGAAGPCDIYQSGNTPCVAAHSTVRALYGAYSGNLYQVRRASDKTTKDIVVLTAGGVANSATQDTFCAGTTCTISIIYDQSPNGNDLAKSPPGGWLNNGGLEADATKAKIKLNGHTVYGVYTTSNFDNDIGAVGYRNNKTKGIATGDQPEAMYMVASGKHYNQWCCFDYGNAETNNKDNGPATMEAVYFGNSTQWGKGSGTGPWVMADLEDGVFAGGSTAAAPTNTSLIADYVTAMLKGPAGNRFVLKGGDAQSGSLATKYDGARPAGYSPQKKEGAIILGIGGDNSHTGEGTFFEGCITSGNPSDAIDDAVQANIVAAGYGR